MSLYSAIDRYDEERKSAGTKLGLDFRYLIAPLIALAFTVWIDPYYTGGDPSLYRYVYDALATESLSHGFFFYSTILNSTEPVYYLLSWTLAHLGVPRVIFIGASSAVLALLSTVLLVRRGASMMVATIITSSSFYFLLLYTTTERLKIAVIFLIASALTVNRVGIAIAFAFLAVASHIQVGLIYLSLLMIYLSVQIKHFAKTNVIPRNFIWTSIGVLIGVVGAYYAISDQVSSKFYSYSGLGQETDLIRVIPFYIITLIYTDNKLNATLLFIPLVLLTPVIGYGRLNIFSYFIFIYYAVRSRRGFNIGTFLTTAYFVYSSYAFISRILENGEPALAVQ